MSLRSTELKPTESVWPGAILIFYTFFVHCPADNLDQRIFKANEKIILREIIRPTLLAHLKGTKQFIKKKKTRCITPQSRDVTHTCMCGEYNLWPKCYSTRRDLDLGSRDELSSWRSARTCAGVAHIISSIIRQIFAIDCVWTARACELMSTEQ